MDISSLSNFEKQAVVSGIQTMFARDWFDICTLESILSILDIKLSDRERTAFRIFHCVNWGNMSAEARDELKVKIIEVVSRSPSLGVIDVEITRATPTDTQPDKATSTNTQPVKTGLIGLIRKAAGNG